MSSTLIKNGRVVTAVDDYFADVYIEGEQIKAIGKDAIIAHATGCMEIVSSPFPTTNWDIPWIHALFENHPAVASGMRSIRSPRASK